MELARPITYVSPFSARYTSPEMSYLFSPQFKISTFRKLWTSLAKAQQQLGLSISDLQIKEMESQIDSIDFVLAEQYEKKFRHDVMAHIHAYGDQCPNAKPIIHLGATSSFVTDNTDLIQLKQGSQLLLSKLVHLIGLLATFAEQEANTVCLSYTHFQAAQPTTMGKRACLWLQDFLLDAQELERSIHSLPFLGAKGATGTQASFLALFEHPSQVKELEKRIASDFGFTQILPIAGQTYTRKIDLHLLHLLESFAASAHKMGTDIRLLAHDGELHEVSTDAQVGSSAMPYKRNPIYSERICGLARFVMSLAQNPAYTLATQWLERSLDDSSNRRLSIPEAFLGTDSILNLLIHLVCHLKVERTVALSRLEAQAPHMAMETILMYAVKKGADRQLIHEQLRQLSGCSLSEIAQKLQIDLNELLSLIQPNLLIGRAPDQVRDFLKSDVEPFLSRCRNLSVPITPIEI